MASWSARALVLALLLLTLVCSSSAQLTTDFYSKSCPTLSSIVSGQVQSAINRESRLGASVLRLFFHDCFVNGCDASLLLDDTPAFTGEKGAAPNLNSARGFEVIDAIKTAVERTCPGVVSCADILALAARDSVSILRGPSWAVKLGRRDARTASQSAAAANIPPPTSNLSQLITFFSNVGLSVKDMVALSGAHTIGLARCTNFRARIYNEPNIDATFARLRQGSCPRAAPAGDGSTAPLDTQTPTVFDNSYYANLVGNRGLLHSDQQLFSGGSTDGTVRSYSQNAATFTADFVTGMINMGDIRPLTGNNGEIRKNCRVRN